MCYRASDRKKTLGVHQSEGPTKEMKKSNQIHEANGSG